MKTRIGMAVIATALLMVFLSLPASAQGPNCADLEGNAKILCEKMKGPSGATPAPGAQPTAKPGAKPTAAPTAKITTSFTGEAGGDWAKVDVKFPEDCLPETCSLVSVKFTEGEPGFLSGWTTYPPTNQDKQKIEGGTRVTIRNAGLKPDTTYSYEVNAKVSGKDVKATGEFKTGAAGFSLPNLGNIRFDWLTCLIPLILIVVVGFVAIRLISAYRRGLTRIPPPDATI